MGCQIQFRAAKYICDERNFVVVAKGEQVNPNLSKNLGFGGAGIGQSATRQQRDLCWNCGTCARNGCRNPSLSEKFGLGLGLSLGLVLMLGLSK